MKYIRFIFALLVLCLFAIFPMPEAYAATVDSQAPVIKTETIAISNAKVTVGDTVSITVEITDNVSVSYVGITLWNDCSDEQIHGTMECVDQSDIYRYDLEITESITIGNWKVNSIITWDDIGNTDRYDSFDSQHIFEVSNTVEPIVIHTDTITIDKERVSVGEAVTIGIEITGTGISRVSFDLINNVSGQQRHFIPMSYNADLDCYVYRFVIDDSVPNGEWEIGFINARSYGGIEIAEFVGSTGPKFTVFGTAADSEAPVIETATLSFDRKEIFSGEYAVLSVKITDNVAVGRVTLSIENVDTGKLLAYPAMTYNEDNGLYEFYLIAGETLPIGRWQLCTIHAEDTTGNLNLQSYYSQTWSVVIKETATGTPVNQVIDFGDIPIANESTVFAAVYGTDGKMLKIVPVLIIDDEVIAFVDSKCFLKADSVKLFLLDSESFAPKSAPLIKLKEQ